MKPRFRVYDKVTGQDVANGPLSLDIGYGAATWIGMGHYGRPVSEDEAAEVEAAVLHWVREWQPNRNRTVHTDRFNIVFL